MTKTLKEIQESNRRKIICAVHDTEDYEKALEMEKGVGCIARINGDDPQPMICEGYNYDDQIKQFGFLYEKYIHSESEDHIFFFQDCPDLEIIGKPLTLSRVMIALEPYPNNYGIIAGHIARINRKNMSYKFICKLDFTKETLEEQTEETQRTIDELLTKTEEK